MLRRMSPRQLRNWRVFDAIEPIGGARGDWQAASICAAIFNARMLGSGKVVTPDPFLLQYGVDDDTKEHTTTKPAAQSWQRMKMIAQMHAAASKADKKKRWRK